MSPQKRKKLSKIRSELDKIDNSLIKIIKKRTFLVKKVLELKDRKNQIVDQKRIRSILSNIRKKSLKNKIDKKIINEVDYVVNFDDSNLKNSKPSRIIKVLLNGQIEIIRE